MATTEVKEAQSSKNNYLKGNEKSLEYNVIPAPKDKGRFSLTWDRFSSNTGKMVFINLLMLLCFMPLFVLFYMRQYNISLEGAQGAFGGNLGIGYPAVPDLKGMAESIILRVDTLYFALAILASFFTALALSGGIYCTRKLMRSDEEVKLRDFIVGIKEGYFVALTASIIIFAVLFAAVYIWDYAGYRMATGGSAGLWITLRVLGWVVFAVAVLFSFWLLAIGSNYKQNPWVLTRYTVRFSFYTAIQSILFILMFSVPALLLLLSDIWSMIGYAWFILIGFSVALLIWASFSDWVFDSTLGYTQQQIDVQTQAAEAKKLAGTKISKEEFMDLLLVGSKSVYLSRAIQPLDEGEGVYSLSKKLTADDLAAAAENRAKIKAESEEYAAAHAEEEKYAEYNARFRDREKVVDAVDKKGKKKKFNPKMLNQ